MVDLHRGAINNPILKLYHNIRRYQHLLEVQDRINRKHLFFPLFDQLLHFHLLFEAFDAHWRLLMSVRRLAQIQILQAQVHHLREELWTVHEGMVLFDPLRLVWQLIHEHSRWYYFVWCFIGSWRLEVEVGAPSNLRGCLQVVSYFKEERVTIRML